MIDAAEDKTEFAFVKEIACNFKNIFNEDIEADPQKIKRLE